MLTPKDASRHFPSEFGSYVRTEDSGLQGINRVVVTQEEGLEVHLVLYGGR